MLRLVGANLNYSSWTARAWLALKRAGADFRLHDVGLKTKDGWKERIFQFSGAGKVPVLVDESLSVHESLAICEYLAEKYPEAKLWPSDPALRARGRAISCEMLSGFFAIRNQMPMNVRGRAEKTPTGAELETELARVFDVWEASMATSSGDFLLGDFSIADCMYMPLVARFRTYGVKLPASAEKYSAAIWSLPLVQELEALGAAAPAIPEYDAFLS